MTAWSLLVVGARTNPFVEAGFDRRTGCGGSGQSFVVRDSSQVGRVASWVTLPVASWVMELVFIVQCGQEGSLSVFLRLRAPHVPKKKTLSDLSWRQEVAAPFFFPTVSDRLFRWGRKARRHDHRMLWDLDEAGARQTVPNAKSCRR